MSGYAIDTNVLIVGSILSPGATDAPVEVQRQVHEWLKAFAASQETVLLLDAHEAITGEYRRHLTEQHYGLQAYIEKCSRNQVRFYAIDFDGDGKAQLPAPLDSVVHDRDDRKFVAVALKNGRGARIVNAVDSDWFDWTPALAAEGLVIEQVAEAWCRAKYEARTRR